MGCCGTLESDAGGAWWELPGKSWDHRRHLTGGRAAMIGEQSQRKGRETPAHSPLSTHVSHWPYLQETRRQRGLGNVIFSDAKQSGGVKGNGTVDIMYLNKKRKEKG